MLFVIIYKVYDLFLIILKYKEPIDADQININKSPEDEHKSLLLKGEIIHKIISSS